jgi:ADP-ribose pyrophosphatase YjhB (NUDIX family)
VAREIREELGAEIADIRFLGVIENIFTYAGSKGHEIMLFYSARLVEERFYMQESVLGHDDDGEFVARWVSLDAARRATAEPVYPEGLVDLIEAGDRGPAVEGRSTR